MVQTAKGQARCMVTAASCGVSSDFANFYPSHGVIKSHEQSQKPRKTSPKHPVELPQKKASLQQMIGIPK